MTNLYKQNPLGNSVCIVMLDAIRTIFGGGMGWRGWGKGSGRYIHHDGRQRPDDSGLNGAARQGVTRIV